MLAKFVQSTRLATWSHTRLLDSSSPLTRQQAESSSAIVDTSFLFAHFVLDRLYAKAITKALAQKALPQGSSYDEWALWQKRFHNFITCSLPKLCCFVLSSFNQFMILIVGCLSLSNRDEPKNWRHQATIQLSTVQGLNKSRPKPTYCTKSIAFFKRASSEVHVFLGQSLLLKQRGSLAVEGMKPAARCWVKASASLLWFYTATQPATTASPPPLQPTSPRRLPLANIQQVWYDKDLHWLILVHEL